MMNRRSLLKYATACAGVVAFMPQFVLASLSRDGFDAKNISNGMQGVFGTDAHTESNKVVLSAPTIAENGAVVPVTIKTSLPDVTAIAVFVDKNPTPLAASFTISAGMKPEVSTRIKMRSTSNISAVVQSGGKLYSVTKEVKVTLGGCGG